MSDVEALSSNEGIVPPPFSQPADASNQRAFFTPNANDVITLEPMQLCRDLNELCEENTYSERTGTNFDLCLAELPSRVIERNIFRKILKLLIYKKV